VTDHSDASVVYVDAEFASTFERVRSSIPKVETVLVFDGPAPSGMESADELMAAASATEPDIPEDQEPGATMIYTSGTTGKPKGAYRRASAGREQVAALLVNIGY
jgi:long-chain acyl-CoA synthetase